MHFNCFNTILLLLIFRFVDFPIVLLHYFIFIALYAITVLEFSCYLCETKEPPQPKAIANTASSLASIALQAHKAGP